MTTIGINHLGLTVRDLDQSVGFFTGALSWTVAGGNPDYPYAAVTDGHARLTLWQAKAAEPVAFDRHANIGLHHVAIGVDSESALNDLANNVAAWPGVEVEFMPEPLGDGPRVHAMIREPGGCRVELIWVPQP